MTAAFAPSPLAGEGWGEGEIPAPSLHRDYTLTLILSTKGIGNWVVAVSRSLEWRRLEPAVPANSGVSPATGGVRLQDRLVCFFRQT